MDKNLDEILEVISQYDIKGWSNLKPEQVKYTKIGDGYINTTAKIERIDGEQKDGQVTSMIYKVYGGNLFTEMLESKMMMNSPLVQSLIAYELSKRRWGPKVYALTEKPLGRLEEFIDCHTLKQGEAFENADLSADLAKALARFHSLDLPLPRDGKGCFLDERFLSLESERKTLVDYLKNNEINPEHRKHLEELVDFPIEKESAWLLRNAENIRHRTVLASVDTNYLNRLVRNSQPSDPELTRCLVIDFDLARYTHRGSDLGGHFAVRIFDWSSKQDKRSGASLPTESERKHFLEAYLREFKKLCPDFDEGGLDSLEQVTMEASFYSAVVLIWLLSFFLQAPDVHDAEPAMVTAISTGIKNYWQLKGEYCQKYAKFVTE